MEIEAPTLSSPSSVHQARIIAWTWTYTLSYNKLIPLNGKMNGKGHHCQNATSLPNPNLPVADMPLLWQYLSPTGVQSSIFPLPTIVRCWLCFLPASWLHWGPLLYHESSPSPPICIFTQCYCLPGCSSLLSASLSYHFSILTIFRFLPKVVRWFT